LKLSRAYYIACYPVTVAQFQAFVQGSSDQHKDKDSLRGVSPYGCEEMSGNVWEWCHSLYRSYPYWADDGREDESSSDSCVLRGGAFYGYANLVRCAFRNYDDPDYRDAYVGFRVVVSPFFSER
jgi:formylglycine-generating enzyme required for sulfatase activity